MDRKSIIVLALCFLLMVTWPVLVKKLYPGKPLPPGNTNAVTAVVATNATATNSAALSAASNPPGVVSAPLVPPVPLGSPEELLEVTNSFARYTFSSQGGGIERVELLLEAAGKKDDEVAVLNEHTPHPTLSILGLEGQADANYRLTRTESGVHAEAVLTNGLTIIKNYNLRSNYMVNAQVRLENRSGAPLNLPDQEWVVGTAGPMGPRDDVQTIGTMWFNGDGADDISEGWFANRTLGCIPGTPRLVYRGGESNVVWAAAHNQFFVLAMVPAEPAQSIISRRLELPRPTGAAAQLMATNAPPPHGFFSTLVFPAMTLPAGGALERNVDIYAGPKEYRRLARIGAEMGNELDLVMGYGGFFGFFAKALLLAMNWFHDALRFSYGWAIIAITVIIKVLFWPLTQASTRSMKRMQALQPQMKEIQEKYKDDPARMNKKLMEFMKEHKVSPLGGCLPMLLQIPVFFGFFQMIRSAFELRGAAFFWVTDLSKPDTLAMIPGLGWIPFIGIPGVGLPFNLLPLLMGVTMVWQARLTPPAPGMDPMQQKIMRYMPLMFMVFLYNFSSGLTLYWTVQNLLTILQTKLTRTQPEPAASSPVAPAKRPGLTPAPKKRK